MLYRMGALHVPEILQLRLFQLPEMLEAAALPGNPENPAQEIHEEQVTGEEKVTSSSPLSAAARRLFRSRG